MAYFRLVLLAAALLLALPLTAPLAAQDAGDDDAAADEEASGVQFLDDVTTAIDTAKEEDKRVLIYLSAEGCTPCDYWRDNIWPDEELGEYVHEHLVCVRVDANKDMDTVRRYGVTELPTLVITNSEGTMQLRDPTLSFSTVAEAMAWFEGKIDALDRLDDLQDEWSDESTVETGRELGQVYHVLYRYPDAIDIFTQVIDLIEREEDDAEDKTDEVTLGEIYLMRGTSHDSRRDYDKAIADYDQSMALLEAGSDQRMSARYRKGKAHLNKGEPVLAEEVLAELHDELIEAEDAMATTVAREYAMSLIYQRKVSEAREMLLADAAAFPDDNNAWSLKIFAAYLAMDLGQLEDARSEIDAILDDMEENNPRYLQAKELSEMIAAKEAEQADKD